MQIFYFDNNISDTLDISLAAKANTESEAIDKLLANKSILSEITTEATDYGIAFSTEQYKTLITEAIIYTDPELDLDHATELANTDACILDIAS